VDANPCKRTRVKAGQSGFVTTSPRGTETVVEHETLGANKLVRIGKKEGKQNILLRTCVTHAKKIIGNNKGEMYWKGNQCMCSH
jgi:hypothetical protein